MAPAKPAKAAKNSKDIRAFFDSSASQKQSGSSVRGSQANAIKIEDEEDAPPSSSRSKFASDKPSKQKKPMALVSDSEDEQPRRKPVVAAPSTTNRPANEEVSAVKRKSTIALLSSDEEASPPKKKKVAESKPQGRLSKSNKEDEDSDSEANAKPPVTKRKKPIALLSSDEEEAPPTKKKTVGSKAKPRQSQSSKDDDNFIVPDEDEVPKTKAPRKSEPKATSTGKGKEKQEPKKQTNWAAIKATKLAGPSAPGSKSVPDGEDNCLLGLAFVFTGELSSFSREEATDIAKRFGGRVVGQPSSKTNFVVLGEGAGPSKIAAIKKHAIRTLTEDEFLNLIATRKAPRGKDLDEKTKKKMEKEKEAIRQAAKEMEKREQLATSSSAGPSRPADLSTQLWTTRYAPTNLKEICGNKTQVEKLHQWLIDWPNSLKSGFKKPGKNAMNIFRAVLITGSPGIGKTTSAHLCAKLAGFTPIELNASDARSKKLVQNGMNINNTSLDGYIAGGAKNSLGMTITDRTCLIMDEVDGMSAGDRGGVGALNALIKKSKVPIICIANDRNAQKLRPLQSTTFSLPFSRPQANAVRSRIMSVIFKEKMSIPANVLDQLVAGAQSDIRQVLNMLSTWKLSSDTMTFDEGKLLTQMNEKYTIMSPFDITSKILGPYLFSHTSRATLGDKMELYFQDHSFVPLFIQENYLKSEPSRLRNLEGPDKILRQLQLMDKAASSISDGDLVDGMIHGPEQQWSLMPFHAVCSTVLPASFQYGQGVHFGGPNSMSFPQWLGQNSKQNKLGRQLGEVQTRMRLKVSADKSEIRQSYIPALFPHVVQPLVDVGATKVDEVIQRMDDYFISKDDWDTLIELGVGENRDETVLKKISSAVKTAFTKKYNSNEHPIPFHKAQDLGRIPKKLAGGPAPDIEDAFEVDDVEDEEPSEDEKDDQKDDVKNDKLIKAPKQKKKGQAKK